MRLYSLLVNDDYAVAILTNEVVYWFEVIFPDGSYFTQAGNFPKPDKALVAAHKLLVQVLPEK